MEPKSVQINSGQVFIRTADSFHRSVSVLRIPPDVFMDRWRICCASLGVSLPTVDPHAHQLGTTLPRFKTVEFVKWAVVKNQWEVPPELAHLLADEQSDFLERPSRLTSGVQMTRAKKAANNCATWLRGQDRMPGRNKAEVYEAAKQALGPEAPFLSGRAFQRLWDQNARPEWTRPGCKKKG